MHAHQFVLGMPFNRGWKFAADRSPPQHCIANRMYPRRTYLAPGTWFHKMLQSASRAALTKSKSATTSRAVLTSKKTFCQRQCHIVLAGFRCGRSALAECRAALSTKHDGRLNTVENAFTIATQRRTHNPKSRRSAAALQVLVIKLVTSKRLLWLFHPL